MTQETRGILLMVSAVFVFAVQDGISRHLASEYNIYMVVMIRYWFFAAFVIAWSRIKFGSIRKIAKTRQPFLQAFRAILLVTEILVAVKAFVLLGLIENHAIFAVFPLMIAALSGPVLGEHVGWRRWIAIGIGFVGVLIILQPGSRVFQLAALLPAASALMFALYGLLTRYAARQDSAATSFFWTGVVGAIAMTSVGVFHWEEMSRPDWGWMLALSIAGVSGHYLLIRCYEVTEASAVQPFAYLHMVFAAAIGFLIFGEDLRVTTLIGALVVLAAGLFTLSRERQSTVPSPD